MVVLPLYLIHLTGPLRASLFCLMAVEGIVLLSIQWIIQCDQQLQAFFARANLLLPMGLVLLPDAPHPIH